jgi:hypothetical protein
MDQMSLVSTPLRMYNTFNNGFFHLGENPFVEVHENGVLLGHLPIEDALHVPVGTQRFLKMMTHQTS